MCQQNQEIFLPPCPPHHYSCCSLWRTVHWCLQHRMLTQDYWLHHWHLSHHLHCQVYQEEVQKGLNKRVSDVEGQGRIRGQVGSDEVAVRKQMFSLPYTCSIKWLRNERKRTA